MPNDAIRRFGWAYRVVASAPTRLAWGYVVEVTEPGGSTYRTLVDCDVWEDAVEGKPILAHRLDVGVRRVWYLVISLPDAALEALGLG